MKRVKFKNDEFGDKKFYQIVFDRKKISEIWGAVISSTKQHYYPEPSNWTYKEIKFKPMDRSIPSEYLSNDSSLIGMPGREAISYYKGKLKNKKRHGKGLEIIFQIRKYLPLVVSFYKGNWRNGKKYGKGFWSNYHPTIGQCYDSGADNPKYFVKKIWDTECSFTGTFKNNEFDKGILVSSKGSFKGTFKNNKFKISNG